METARPSSSLGQLFKGHVQLLRHEYKHEKDIASRRLRAIGAGAMLFFFGVLALEAAAVGGLIAAGLPVWGAALIVGALNLAGGYGAIKGFGKRRNDDGPPFEMTKAEFTRTTEWMQKSFFSNSNGSAKK